MGSSGTATKLQSVIDAAVNEVGRILLGKEAQIRLALCCLFARGHLLIEDVPGVGKTSLADEFAGTCSSRVTWSPCRFQLQVMGPRTDR